MAVQDVTNTDAMPQIYVGIAKVFNDLRRTEVPAGFATDYHMIDIVGGGILPVERGKYFAGSGPLAEISYSMVTGSLVNRASHQEELALRLGWWQRLYRGIYVLPKVSVGRAWNELNFGEGLVPKPDKAVLVGGTSMAGYSLQITDDFDLGFAGGYFYERSITGTDYLNCGPLVQVTVKAALTKK